MTWRGRQPSSKLEPSLGSILALYAERTLGTNLEASVADIIVALLTNPIIVWIHLQGRNNQLKPELISTSVGCGHRLLLHRVHSG